jgi:hypothetical protein
MKSVLRGYAKDKDGNLILIGTMASSPRQTSIPNPSSGPPTQNGRKRTTCIA